MPETTLGTFVIEEATVRSDGADEAPVPAARVRLPGPMLAYKCNEQGCCCGGWRIPFKPGDLVRLGRYVDDAERQLLTTDVDLRVELGPDGERRVKDLSIVDADGRCRFLADDRKRCGIHAKYGLPALPDVCVDFPVAAYDGDGAVDFHYDPVCPSVLDAIAASDEPVTIVEKDTPQFDPAMSIRSAHARGTPVARAGAASLTPGQIDLIRRRVIASLADVQRPVWQHLLAIDAAYAEVARGDRAPEAFALSYDHDPRKYLRFLRDSIAAHGTGTLGQVWERYRRFVFAIPTDARSGRWHELEKHLAKWEPAFETWLAPADDALRPLQLRWLAHRHFAPFIAIQGELRFAAGAITHAFATSLRYAAAFGAVLNRVVDRDVMKVAFGAGEYLYRSLEIPPDSLPWYGLSD